MGCHDYDVESVARAPYMATSFRRSILWCLFCACVVFTVDEEWTERCGRCSRKDGQRGHRSISVVTSVEFHPNFCLLSLD